MKTINAFIAVFVVLGVMAFNMASAGSQTNWGTSTGANWVTPDDTTVQVGQALVVTSSVPYPTIGTSSTTPLGLGSFTATQVVSLTPKFIGQIIFCSNCVTSFLCVSTGTTAQAFAAVQSSMTAAPNVCK